jgi:opacity protein-like surface antigen
MRQFQALLFVVSAAGLASAVAPALRADTGVQIGARSGIQLLDDDALGNENALSVGAEARLSFELSPLIVALSFDHFFIEERTLFQVGANALYDLPLGHSFLYPYLGAGVGVSRFELPEGGNVPSSNGEAPDGPVLSTSGSSGTGDTQDSNGMRMGLNLVGGVRFDHLDLPVVRPFAQVMLSLGPIDLLTIVGGVLFELDGR